MRDKALRWGKLGDTIDEWREELDQMMAVMVGRVDPPVDLGVSTMLEVSDAYLARVTEMVVAINRMETDGMVKRGSRANLFRTRELDPFGELLRKTHTAGSRRITVARMETPDA